MSCTLKLLLARQSISRQGVVCYTWIPSRNLIEDVKQGLCLRNLLQTDIRVRNVLVASSEVLEFVDEFSDTLIGDSRLYHRLATIVVLVYH